MRKILIIFALVGLIIITSTIPSRAQSKADYFAVLRETLSLLVINPFGISYRDLENEYCQRITNVRRKEDCLQQDSAMNDMLEEGVLEIAKADAVNKKEVAARLLQMATHDINQYHQLRDKWFKTYFPPPQPTGIQPQ